MQNDIKTADASPGSLHPVVVPNDKPQTFRNFDDVKIRWVVEHGTSWRAYLNNVEVGGYSSELKPDCWDGMYAWAIGNKLTPFPKTDEQAKRWIEEIVRRWVARAADLLLGVECNHKWEEEYYGTRCQRCHLFFAHGHAPWDVAGENI